MCSSLIHEQSWNRMAAITELRAFQTCSNFGVVCLQWECSLTVIRPKYEAYSSSLSWRAPVARFAWWDVDERNQQLLTAGWRMNLDPTWTSTTKYIACTFTCVYVLSPILDTINQWVEWMFSSGFKWCILVRLNCSVWEETKPMGKHKCTNSSTGSDHQLKIWQL